MPRRAAWPRRNFARKSPSPSPTACPTTPRPWRPCVPSRRLPNHDSPMKTPLSLRGLLLSSFLLATATVHAWDAEGHRIVAQLGLAALPTDYPAFARDAAAASRI